LPKIDFIAFWLPWGQVSLKYRGSIFPTPQLHFMTPLSTWPLLGWICHIMTLLSYIQSWNWCLNLRFLNISNIMVR